MREKVFRSLEKIYGACMFVAFFGGGLLLIPYVIALIVGGETGAAIANFVNKECSPWIIALASVAVVIGLIAMYVGKHSALSTKALKKKDKDA